MSKIIAIIVVAILSSCAGSKHYSHTFAQTVSLPVASTVEVIKPPIEGTNAQGTNLAEKLVWLQRNAESHNTYIIEVNANENIAPSMLEYRGAINVTVVLRGDSVNRTIRLSSHGTMFTIEANVTFILDNNITLQGHRQNTGYIVFINRGIFKMNDGATITGNDKSGVYVSIFGTFEMNGGLISANTDKKGGGVSNWGIFKMNGGTISSNTAIDGGGVWEGNVGVETYFEMNGGLISGNTAAKGGGVCVSAGGKFSMSGGNISSNIAKEYGGGVHGFITKTGGIITGYKTDPDNGNVVRDIEGVIARRGHSVYISDNKRRESTAEMRVNLSGRDVANWEQ